MKNIFRAISGIVLIGISGLMLLVNTLGPSSVFKTMFKLLTSGSKGYNTEDYLTIITELIIQIIMIIASVYLIKYSKDLFRPKAESNNSNK